MSANNQHRPALTGKLVRLAAYDPDKYAEDFARWSQNSEFQQLLDSSPAVLRPPKQIQEWIEKNMDQMYNFSICVLEGGRSIGFCGLDGIDWVARNAFVGIGIGDCDYWGKGYGSDAMNEILRFAFENLNLRRVSLNVFGYNLRAQKSYLKVGFKEEGRLRQWMVRAGQRYDLIFMGILREEWEARQPRYEAETRSSIPNVEDK